VAGREHVPKQPLRLTRSCPQAAPARSGTAGPVQPSGPATVLVEDLRIGVVGRAVDRAEQPAEVAAALRTYLRWFSRTARSFGVRVANPKLTDLEAVATRLVAVRFDLRG
jgi:hypothetical protein